MSKKGFFAPYEYVYDEYFNCVICPENQVLSYATTNREGYREFKSKGYICERCSSRQLCTEKRRYEKTVTKHIWSDYLETVEDIRHTPEYKALYERRKETIERVFADAKEKYAMRYTQYRGLTQVTNGVRLKFAAMNLKKYALHRWIRSHRYEEKGYLYGVLINEDFVCLGNNGEEFYQFNSKDAKISFFDGKSASKNDLINLDCLFVKVDVIMESSPPQLSCEEIIIIK